MCKLESHRTSFFSLLGVCLLSSICSFLVTPSVAGPGSTDKTSLQDSKNLIVSAKDGLVSVKATDAPLKDVIERIGQDLGIDVEAQVGDNEKVTAEFHNLALDQAMERLSGNYAYTTDSDGSNIVKLFVYPKGETAPPSPSVMDTSGKELGRRASSPEPFKFEFDPADYIQQGQ